MSKDIEKLQARLNTVELLAKALADGAAKVIYDPAQKKCLVEESFYHPRTGEKQIAKQVVTPDVVDDYISRCNDQMMEFKTGYDNTKIARTNAELLRDMIRKQIQENLPDTLD